MHAIAVKPVTLEVGDYVLTPDICVERKSISDLTQSLASGRLYNQAEMMLRYYKRPALLIEFDESKPFALINPSDIAADISPQALTSKLSLLLLHFPKLRLLWSRSPLHTVSIFQVRSRHSVVHSCHVGSPSQSNSLELWYSCDQALKINQPEPDVNTAAAMGAPVAQGAEQLFNMTPQDFLRQLPGVYAHNCRKLMNSVQNLRELATKSKEELTTILGSQNAKLLYDFLHRQA